jgi:hypothetical protein
MVLHLSDSGDGLMPTEFVTFPPFGFGRQTDTNSQMQSIYTDLYNLRVSQVNFAPNAGIHESYFAWDIHDHGDGSLGDKVINDEQFRKVPGSSRHSQLLFTQEPKLLILAGETTLDTGQASMPLWIDFGSTSYQRLVFPAGTQPSVFVTAKRRTGTVGTYTRSLFVVDIQSTGFAVSGVQQTNATYTGPAIQGLYYLAMGIIPGWLEV